MSNNRPITYIQFLKALDTVHQYKLQASNSYGQLKSRRDEAAPFLKAMDTIHRYKLQVTGSYEQMKRHLDLAGLYLEPITKETPVLEYISMRANHALFRTGILDSFTKPKEEVTLGELAQLKKSQLKALGKKSEAELEKLLFQVGIILE